MSFIQPCFIRKNTPELRNKLEELGYRYCSTFDKEAPYLWLGEGVIYDTFNVGITILEVGEYLAPYGKSCGDNEELFLALAALRDDSSKNQWFVDSEKNWFMYNKTYVSALAKTGCVFCHKATVKELIEYFNNK